MCTLRLMCVSALLKMTTKAQYEKQKYDMYKPTRHVLPMTLPYLTCLFLRETLFTRGASTHSLPAFGVCALSSLC